MRARTVTTVCLALILAACASSPPKHGFEMAVADGSVSLQLSRQAVVELLEDGLDATLDCNTEPDAELRALLEPLVRRRFATTSVGEGEDRVVARRRGSSLQLTVGDRHAAHLDARLPWAVAECLLGRDITLSEALGSRAATVTLTTAEGTTVRASLR